MSTTDRLDTFMERAARRSTTKHMSAAVLQPATGLRWSWHEPGAPRQYYIASITKLFTTAIIMKLRATGALELSTPVMEIIGDTMAGLHRISATDHSAQVTVEQLLRHTSGLPDYFEGKQPDGSSLFTQITANDRSWSRDQMWDWVRTQQAHFAPGTPGKAHYSDTNYQLLGEIIEQVDGRSYEHALTHHVTDPLALLHTYLSTPATLSDSLPTAGLLWGKRDIDLSQALASFGPDGSIVSTAEEQVRFLHAFMTGQVFPREYIDEMTARFTRVFYPMAYGLGVMRFRLSRLASPFVAMPEFIGHSGASGVVTYYIPAKDAYVALVANQVKHRGLVHQLLARLQMSIPAP